MKNATSKSALQALVLAGALISLSVYGLSDQQRSEIEERIRPHGQLCLEGDDRCGSAGAAVAEAGGDAEASASDPKAIYDQYCTACHTTGVAGAPKLGEAADWGDRLAAGMDEVYAHAINGLGAMPPKGTCMSCSDDDIKATVDYMVEAQE